MKHKYLVFPLTLTVFFLLIWPSASLFLKSFQFAGPALFNYGQLVLDPVFRTALAHSLLLSFGVAMGSILLCLGPAWLFARKEFHGKRLLRSLFTLPMSFSGIIIGFIVVLMLGRIGFLPQMLERCFHHAWFSGLAYRFGGLLLAYLYFEIPRATLTLESSLRKFDFQLEAAARSLGANRWQRLAYVVFPLITPALFSAFAVTFCVSLGSFGVALIVSKRFFIAACGTLSAIDRLS